MLGIFTFLQTYDGRTFPVLKICLFPVIVFVEHPTTHFIEVYRSMHPIKNFNCLKLMHLHVTDKNNTGMKLLYSII